MKSWLDRLCGFLKPAARATRKRREMPRRSAKSSPYLPPPQKCATLGRLRFRGKARSCSIFDGDGLVSAQQESGESKDRQEKGWHVLQSFVPNPFQVNLLRADAIMANDSLQSTKASYAILLNWPAAVTSFLGSTLTKKTPIMCSLGSIQKLVPAAPPQLYSPSEPTVADLPGPRFTANVKPKP